MFSRCTLRYKVLRLILSCLASVEIFQLCRVSSTIRAWRSARFKRIECFLDRRRVGGEVDGWRIGIGIGIGGHGAIV